MSADLSTATLRLATMEDADAIAALTGEAYRPWVALIGREPLPMTVDYADALRRHRFDLLEVLGQLAGLIETVPDGDHLLIENVAVRPDLQGRGIGRRLLAHAESLAVEAGLKGVRLYTNRRFERNVELYRRLGYRIEREVARTIGITVYMIKACPAS